VRASTTTYAGLEPQAEGHLDAASTDFYRLWLDPTLTYSCALFNDGEDATALDAAQLRKLDFHIERSRAIGQARLLDIGCGWGSLLHRAVTTHGVRKAVGLTLNAAQAEWAARTGDPRIEVRHENWWDHAPVMPYDAIVSVAAFEAFARPGMTFAERVEAYRSFFGRCHDWLRPGGHLSLQTLGFDDPWGIDGDNEPRLPYGVPTPAALARSASRLFKIVEFRNYSSDSVRTLRAWLSRLQAARPAAVAVAGEAVVRQYEHVLRSALMTFRWDKLHLYRLTLCRVDRPH
jgi:cyclopropane-fatty-acyl-phospholipid synthase